MVDIGGNRHELCEPLAVGADHLQVQPGHVVFTDRPQPTLEDLVHHADVAVDGVAHRQRDVRRHAGPQPRAVTLDLGSGTEVHHRADAAAAQFFEIVEGQCAQAIGAKQRSHPHMTPAPCGIAADVTAVVRALEGDDSIPTHGLAG